MRGIILAGGSRHAAASDDAGRLQAAAADLRQADDLLSADDADARRHPRNPGHLDAAGSAAVPAAARRRRAMGPRADLRRAAAARRPRAGLHHRRGFRRRPSGRRWCSATISFTATACRNMLVAAAARREPGATVFAYHVQDPERYGVVAFDDDGQSDSSIEEKPAAAAFVLGGDRALFLRRARRRFRRKLKPSRARRTGDHRPQPRSISSAANCGSRSWAAASPGSTPARRIRCSRRPNSSARWKSARASRSPAPRRSPIATAGFRTMR